MATTVNDLVLIYLQDKPLSFARVEAIEPDYKRGWYHVTLLLLQIPLQVVTWILRDAYINGETFHHGQQPHAHRAGGRTRTGEDPEAQPPETDPASPKPGKVISLKDLKKK